MLKVDSQKNPEHSDLALEMIERAAERGVGSTPPRLATQSNWEITMVNSTIAGSKAEGKKASRRSFIVAVGAALGAAALAASSAATLAASSASTYRAKLTDHEVDLIRDMLEDELDEHGNLVQQGLSIRELDEWLRAEQLRGRF